MYEAWDFIGKLNLLSLSLNGEWAIVYKMLHVTRLEGLSPTITTKHAVLYFVILYKSCKFQAKIYLYNAYIKVGQLSYITNTIIRPICLT